MGKKRIKVIGTEETARKTKEEKGRKIVKTGKEHGRITDMGAEALAEAKRLKEKEKKLEKETKTKAKKITKKKPKVKAKKRGKKYLMAKKKVDRNKVYPLPKAIKLAQETSISKFNGSIETHLVVKETGLKGEVKFPRSTGKVQFKTEAKAPLIHLVIGKVDSKANDLEANFKALVEAVGPKNIRKAIITSTMGPGIKVDLTSI